MSEDMITIAKLEDGSEKVKGNDGYIDVEPLLPSGHPKAKGSVLFHTL